MYELIDVNNLHRKKKKVIFVMNQTEDIGKYKKKFSHAHNKSYIKN